MARLLVVEDDALFRVAITQSLIASGYQVEAAENGLRALELAARQPFDLIISDIRMPVMDGVSAVSHIKIASPHIKTILITGYADEEPLARALNLGVDGILKKPFAIKELLKMISLKMEEREQEKAREEKYGRIFSRLSRTLGLEKTQELLEEEPVFPSGGPDDLRRGATLAELGKTAQMRREFDVAIQAYESALEAFSDGKNPKEELSVRLALSSLFYAKGRMDPALAHAEKGLELARRAKHPPLLIDAFQNYSRLLVNADPARSMLFLQNAKHLLEEDGRTEKQAVCCLIEASLALKNGDAEEAQCSVNRFLLFGKRHFLPSLLVSMPDIALPPVIFALENKLHPENARWLLEEAAPCLQEKLREIIFRKPSLKAVLSDFLHGPGDRPYALKIFTLGNLRIIFNGTPLAEEQWPSLKGRSLLLYLFYEHPKLISEEHLLEVFWPRLSPVKARHSLRTTLYYIRRTLTAEQTEKIICRERQKYGVQHGASVVCDFILFRNYCGQAKSDWGKGNFDRAIFPMKEAEKLYQGAFLPGWNEEWSLAAREDFHGCHLWMMLAFAAYSRKQKKWDDLSAYAKKALDAEPACEEAHAFLVESFLELGKRDDAVRQYHLCRDILWKELEVEPSEQLRNYYLKAVDSTAMADCHA